MIISIALLVLNIVALWMIFTKAGESGWKSLIPIYNCYVLFKIAKNEGFIKYLISMIIFTIIYSIELVLLICLSVSPSSSSPVALIICSIICLVLFVYICILEFKMYADLAANFGKEKAFAWGLFWLRPIFMCILAFGKDNYIGTDEISEKSIN